MSEVTSVVFVIVSVELWAGARLSVIILCKYSAQLFARKSKFRCDASCQPDFVFANQINKKQEEEECLKLEMTAVLSPH